MPEYRVREGDTWADIARRYGVDQQTLLQINPNVNLLNPGASINLPYGEKMRQRGTDQSQNYNVGGSPDAGPTETLGDTYRAPSPPQPPTSGAADSYTPGAYPGAGPTETLGEGYTPGSYPGAGPTEAVPTPPRFGMGAEFQDAGGRGRRWEGAYPGQFPDTAPQTDKGVVYPEGYNPSEFLTYLEYAPMSFISDLYSGYYTQNPETGEPTGALPAFPGLPSSHKFSQDPETGEWEAKPSEAVMDEILIANGIDPEDPEMVEWFFQQADEDLLQMAEVFDLIDYAPEEAGWGWGGGGGGWGGYSTPARRLRRRNNYQAGLGLVNWRI